MSALLRHEVHAAENNEFGIVSIGGGLRQLERITPEVGELDDFISLIMMAKE
jgi:hypothetical protein